MTSIKISKYHGCQNDFILLDNRTGVLPEAQLSTAAIQWCHRHTGLGADGLITVENATDHQSDIRMRIINADGSEPEMCGNGIRCYAKFVQDTGILDQSQMSVETLAGQMTSMAHGGCRLTNSAAHHGGPVRRTEGHGAVIR